MDTPEIKPMSIKVYNAIVKDFNKMTSFNRKSEIELKKKYKE